MPQLTGKYISENKKERQIYNRPFQEAEENIVPNGSHGGVRGRGDCSDSPSNSMGDNSPVHCKKVIDEMSDEWYNR